MSVNDFAVAAAYNDSGSTSRTIITNLVNSRFPIFPSTISCSCFTPHRTNNFKLVQTYSTSSSVSPSLVVIDQQTATSQLPPPVSPCPRRLILLRHAHSSYPNASLRGIYSTLTLVMCFFRFFAFFLLHPLFPFLCS